MKPTKRQIMIVEHFVKKTTKSMMKNKKRLNEVDMNSKEHKVFFKAKAELKTAIANIYSAAQALINANTDTTVGLDMEEVTDLIYKLADYGKNDIKSNGEDAY